ncbi:hypothetical protein L7F22_054930 [Adiantum nelumboides]|nr:hypothetical protein [Adiantum nelumboides]
MIASHVSKTIIKPTELLMTKIQQAEIMKDEYDAERKLYILSLMEKKAKAKKGNGSMGQPQTLVDEKSVQAKANLLTLYMQSLTRGQSVNLVDQAVKYHSAHMHLFSNGFASTNAVEPMIRQVALDRMIDTTLSEEEGLITDSMNSFEMNTKAKVQKCDFRSDSAASSLRHHLVEQTASPCYLSDSSEEIYSRRSAFASKSAPVSPLVYHRREVKENVQESSLDNEHESVAMYALPSPLNECGRQVGDNSNTGFEKHSGLLANQLEEFSGEIVEASKVEHKTDMSLVQLSHPLLQQDHSIIKGKNLADCTDDDGMYKPIVEKDQRYTQSGPLVDSPSNNKHLFANVRRTGPTAFHEEHMPALFKSVPIRRSPLFSYTSGNFSPPSSSMNLSPPSSSAVSISELHPLPPPGSKTPPKSPNDPPNPITHSAPLGKVKRYADQIIFFPVSSAPCVKANILSMPMPTKKLQDLKAGGYT